MKARLFWNEKRNKLKYITIIKFLGLEIKEIIFMNHFIYELFKSESKKLIILNEYINKVFSSVNEFISNSNILLYTYGCLLERCVDDEDVKFDFFLKLLILKKFYSNYQIYFSSVNININLNPKIFKSLLYIFFSVWCHIDKNTLFNDLSFENIFMSDEHLVIVKDFLINTKNYSNLLPQVTFSKIFVSLNGFRMISEMINLNLINKLAIRDILSQAKNLSFYLIFKEIKNSSYIQHLYLENCSLSDNYLNNLSESIEMNSNILTFSISRQDISEEVFFNFFQKICNNKKINKLEFKSCSLNSKACECIKFINNNILELNLSDNNIDNIGAINILKTLQTKSLIKLYLNGNNFDYKICNTFSKLLSNNNNLELLSLSDNIERETLLTKLLFINDDSTIIKTKICREILFKTSKSIKLCSKMDICNKCI